VVLPSALKVPAKLSHSKNALRMDVVRERRLEIPLADECVQAFAAWAARFDAGQLAPVVSSKT
jgi:hypothetical protein